IGAAASGVVAAAWASREILYVPETFVLLIVYSISLGLVNADTGALIGFGASRGDTWRTFLRAIGVRLAHGAFLAPFLPQVDRPYGALAAVTSVGLALMFYYFVYLELYPSTLTVTTLSILI